MSIKLTEAERVSDLIKGTGKTLTQVAAESGISQNRLSDWANNKLKDGVRTSTLKKACDYFQCSADYLLGRSDVPRRDPDLDMIQKYTGLSFDAINLLHEAYELVKIGPVDSDELYLYNYSIYFLDIVNRLIASNEIHFICDAIQFAVQQTHLIACNKLRTVSDDITIASYIDAGQYRASFEFSKFIETYFERERPPVFEKTSKKREKT